MMSFGKRPIAPIIALLSILYGMFYLSPVVQAGDDPLIYWLYDAKRADSQFGFTQGATTGAIGPVHVDRDLEGVACIGAAVYATSGGDGKVPSALYQIDPATGALQEIGPIATGATLYYEVASLAEKDGQLWAYAAEGDSQGILQIDPATGQAALIYAPAQSLDVSSVAWLDGILYLGARAKVYSWAPGGDITYRFTTTLEQIEAMDAIDGALNLAGDGQAQIQVYSPSGEYKGHRLGFIPTDIESLAFCLAPVTAPTPTDTSTAAPTLTATATSSPTPTLTQESATATAVPPASATPTIETTATTSALPTITPTPTSTPVPPAAQASPTPPLPLGTSAGTPSAPTADRETAETRQFVIYIDVDDDGSQGADDFYAAAGTVCSVVRLDMIAPGVGSTRMLFIGANGTLTVNDLEANATYEMDCARRLTYQFNTADVAGAVVTQLGMAPIKVWTPVVSR